jgi:DNA ligase-1
LSISTFSNLIDVCQQTSGKGSRNVISQAISNLDSYGQKLCHLALNPYITFGIKQVPEPDFQSTNDADLELFFDLCAKLESRELTGNRAKGAIMDCLMEYTAKTAELLSRVLRKNLQANFNVKTYNQATTGEKIPMFSVMLADKIEQDDELVELLSDGLIADYKYDGVRTIVIADGADFKFFSREGVEMPYCQGLFDEDLTKIYNKYGAFALDAEQFNGTWETTMNARKSGDSSAKQNLGLKAFFIMPLSDWMAQKTEITMLENRHTLQYLIHHLDLSKIVITGANMVSTVAEIKEMLAEVTTPEFDGIDKGHEGLILKNPNATYQWKRSIDWCKMKNFYDVDLQVLEVLPGRPNTKYANVLGKVRARGYLEDGSLVEGLVGSGFNDEQRKRFFENPDEIVGMTIVASYQEVTKPSAKSPIPNLRFCTFTRIRDDKTVDLEE